MFLDFFILLFVFSGIIATYFMCIIALLSQKTLLMLSGYKDGGALTANLTDRIAVSMKNSANRGSAKLA